MSPGQRLKEEELTARCGASRTPVREALRRLGAEGLVVMTPRQGAEVAAIGLEELGEIYALRAILERHAAARSSTRLCRTHALGRIFDVLGALLGQKTPQFLCAAGISSSPHLMFSGYDGRGEWFQLFQIGFGGIPGRPFGDGADGHSLWPGFTNVPNEFLERDFPMRIETYESVADIGGAGLFRDGNGILMSYRFLEPGTIAIHDDRWFIPP